MKTRNIQLGMLNEFVSALILRESRAYFSADSIENPGDYELRYPVKLLDSIPSIASMPHQNLSLKRSQEVMLLGNLYLTKGKCLELGTSFTP